MKKLTKKTKIVAGVVLGSMVFGLTGLTAAFAATTPSLGVAATYALLSSTYTNTTITTINGDVGFTTGPAVTPSGTHTNYGSGAPYATAGIDQGSALSTLASQACTFTFAPGAINLSTDTTHGTAGVYAPGVYCSTGAMNVGGPLALRGNGTYVFRSVGALTTTAGAVVTVADGASACNVFWTPSEATTLAANTTFAGTVIDAAGITVGANTTWTGTALAFGGTVTTDTDTITVPVCTTPTATLNDIAPIVVTPPSPAATTTPILITTATSTITTTTTIVATSTPFIPTTTVVAPTPGLPNTGLPPLETNIIWGLIVLSVIVLTPILFYFGRGMHNA